MSLPRDCVPALRRAGPHPPYILYEMVRWASALPVRHGWKGRTCRDLWDASPRGEWLLGYADRAGADRRDLVRAAAACVRPALRFVGAGEDRPRLAVEAAERWADEPTEGNRRRAGKAAMSAREAGALWAACAGADVAWLVSAGAGALDAAWEAARAHGQAEGPESEAAAHRACADEVRRLVPFIDLAEED